jgi:hypothetical protein
MNDFPRWIWCGAVGLMGIVGLFLSSGSPTGSVSYWGGIAFFAFAVFFIILQIKAHFDHAEHARH